MIELSWAFSVTKFVRLESCHNHLFIVNVIARFGYLTIVLDLLKIFELLSMKHYLSSELLLIILTSYVGVTADQKTTLSTQCFKFSLYNRLLLECESLHLYAV